MEDGAAIEALYVIVIDELFSHGGGREFESGCERKVLCATSTDRIDNEFSSKSRPQTPRLRPISAATWPR